MSRSISGKERKPKLRLDEHLVMHGYFASLKEAQALVMAGKVSVNGEVVSKPGTPIKADAAVSVKGIEQRYVSRGGYKMEKALAVLPVDVKGKVVFDAGAASGGFTDCLLQHGASLVYAVDVGFGQLKGKLAADPRVINWERTNIGDVGQEDLDPPIDACVADLSYLSLVKAVPLLKGLFRGSYEIICLVKPLFEGLPQDKKADRDALKTALVAMFTELRDQGIDVAAVTSSPILGSRESVEFLMLLRTGENAGTPGELAETAIAALGSEPPAQGPGR